MVKIVFPEVENSVVAEAVEKYVKNCPEFLAVGAESLEKAGEMVRKGKADALIAGIDCASRDVILACRDKIGVAEETFSASFVMKRGEEIYVLADAAACKKPTAEQLFDIICQTYETAKAVLPTEPRVALLSWSTKGSGGADPVVLKMLEVLERVREERPEIVIDGELQLDAAVNERIGAKKAGGSAVAGRANVLIVPDLNVGNILYKAMEQFGGFTAAGPILQGFKSPCSDLSRGSTVEDVLLVIETICKLIERRKHE